MSDHQAGMREQIDRIFKGHRDLPDHRNTDPWLTGCLGDVRAPVWFVAENPSLSQVKKLSNSAGRQRWARDDPEQQWAVSDADELFRRLLCKHGFKTGGEFAPGGWRCYITDVVKSAYPAREWRERRVGERRAIAEKWAPVLAWELRRGSPKVIVTLGKEAELLLDHILKQHLLPDLPERDRIDHYSYIAFHPDRKRGLGPMHPIRVKEYDAEFARLARYLKG